jgi:hypothetical protein
LIITQRGSWSGTLLAGDTTADHTTAASCVARSARIFCPHGLFKMKAYLELVPNAPNAEKAKEQIWIWQDKENRGTN